MISINPIQIWEKELPMIKQAPWTFSVFVLLLALVVSFGTYEWLFKEIVSHQQSTITMLRDELSKKPSQNSTTKPTSTATQTASPGGVNAAGSDVKVGDIGCPTAGQK
jgi:cytoskeletal protein RodZ